jgi:hypothetical protein
MTRFPNRSLFALIAIALCHSAYAAIPGLYMGAGAGTSKLAFPNQTIYSPQSVDTNRNLSGLSGRAYAGYNVNSYLGFEAGITRYAQATFNSYQGSMQSSLDYAMSAIDLVAKTYLPVGDRRLNLYALGGIAAVDESLSWENGGVPFLNDVFPVGTGSKSHRKIRPIYGVGVGYDIPKSQFSVSVELTRLQGAGDMASNPHSSPPADMVGLSLTYHFD